MTLQNTREGIWASWWVASRSENPAADCDLLSDTKEAEKVLRSQQPGGGRQEGAALYQKQTSAHPGSNANASCSPQSGCLRFLGRPATNTLPPGGGGPPGRPQSPSRCGSTQAGRGPTQSPPACSGACVAPAMACRALRACGPCCGSRGAHCGGILPSPLLSHPAQVPVFLRLPTKVILRTQKCQSRTLDSSRTG